jgi:hypothetical protein
MKVVCFEKNKHFIQFKSFLHLSLLVLSLMNIKARDRKEYKQIRP